MLHDTEMLQYVYKTADMGCAGIESVIDRISGDPLKNDLKAQHDEYLNIRGEANSLLQSRNEEPKGIGMLAKMSAELMTSGKMMADRSDSKIAEMTIQGNQMGINKTIKHLHDYTSEDSAVRNIAEKLLATEQTNAEQLKKYL